MLVYFVGSTPTCCSFVINTYMRLYEIENRFIKNQHKADGIDIPVDPDGQPYKTFFVEPRGKNSGAIYGVTQDGDEIHISTATLKLAHALAQVYTTGGYSDSPIQKVSLDPFYDALTANGIKLAEKPDWVMLNSDKYTTDPLSIRRVEKELGHSIPHIDGVEYFGRQLQNGPLVSFVKQPPSEYVIVDFDGNQYLAYRGGMSTYMRFWTKIQ